MIALRTIYVVLAGGREETFLVRREARREAMSLARVFGTAQVFRREGNDERLVFESKAVRREVRA